MINAIEVTNLSKRFEEVQAVAGADFQVTEGELFGFLGPNGAGKTTTINMLTGLARPDSGTIHIGGIDCSKNPKASQHLIGIVPDESNLYPELSGFDNLVFCGSLYGMRKADREKRAGELLDWFGLSEAARRKFAGYSKGMKRKLTIAAGIIHSPPLLFLDEPTSGIDVASARQIRRLIADLNKEGTTIFLTTHYIEEAERLCGRIAFIVAGRIVRTDTVENLMQSIQGRNVLKFEVTTREEEPSRGKQTDSNGRTDDNDNDLLNGSGTGRKAIMMLCEKLSKNFPELESYAAGGTGIRIESSRSVHIGPIVRFMEDHGLDVLEARKERPSLEDVFVHVTGIEAAEMKLDSGKQRKKGGNKDTAKKGGGK
ncbi:MAG: ABC transporter ATP-binding protein [Spirochaetia bacterium]